MKKFFEPCKTWLKDETGSVAEYVLVTTVVVTGIIGAATYLFPGIADGMANKIVPIILSIFSN